MYNNLLVFLEPVDEPWPTYACGQLMQGSRIVFVSKDCLWEIEKRSLQLVRLYTEVKVKGKCNLGAQESVFVYRGSLKRVRTVFVILNVLIPPKYVTSMPALLSQVFSIFFLSSVMSYTLTPSRVISYPLGCFYFSLYLFHCLYRRQSCDLVSVSVSF